MANYTGIRTHRNGPRCWPIKRLAISLFVAFAVLFIDQPGVHAADIQVNGPCTLNDAITAANTDIATGKCGAGSGTDTLMLTGMTYTLNQIDNITGRGANGLPQITSAMIIQGNGATIMRPASAPSFRIFEVAANGNLTLNDLTILGGLADASLPQNNRKGGGILSLGVVTLNNSTLTENRAEDIGGGIWNSGQLTLNNSTVSGNHAATRSGGINNVASGLTPGETTLINSTVTGNTVDPTPASSIGGGIHADAGTVTLINSLVAGNSALGGAEIYIRNTGSLNSAGVNLFGNAELTSEEAFFGFTPGANDIVATSNGAHPAKLAAILDPTLAANGGPSLTHALVPNSPAIDAAGACPPPSVDQRYVARPQGKACDIGAFEVESTPTDTPTSTNTPTPTGTSTSTPTPTPTATSTGTGTPTPTAIPTNTSTTTATSVTRTPADKSPTPTSTATNVATATPQATQFVYMPVVRDDPTLTPTATLQPKWEHLDNNSNLHTTTLSVQGTQLFVGRRDGDKGFYQRNLVGCQLGQALTPIDLGKTNTVLGTVFHENKGLLAAYGSHLFYSTNNGQSWIQTGLNVENPRTVAIASNDIFYAGAETDGVYQSVDGGVTWTLLKKIDKKEINQIRLDALDTNLLWIATNKDGVLKLTVDLERLVDVNEGLSGANKEVWDFAFDSTNIYIATADGVFVRSDREPSWQRFGANLQNKKVLSLELRNNQFLYAGTSGAGVWSRPLDGSRDWVAVTSAGWNGQTTVRDLLYDDQQCHGLLAATDAGVWVYR